MKAKKIVYIDTGLFSLQIYWNGAVFGLHLGVLIGLIALNVMTRTLEVHKLCLVFLIIEILAILILLLRGFSIAVEDATEERSKKKKDSKEDAPVEKSSMDVAVDRKKKKGSSVKEEKDQVIKNKVPNPSTGSSTAPVANKSDNAVDNAKESASEELSTEDTIAKMASKFSDNAMTEEDWEELFKI